MGRVPITPRRSAPIGASSPFARSSFRVQAPAATTTAEPSMRPASVVDADHAVAVAGQGGDGDALADVGAEATSPFGQRPHEQRRVDVRVGRAVARPEHVVADRRHQPAHLGALDHLHRQPVAAPRGDELLDHVALVGGQVEDQPARLAELERQRQLLDELRVELAGGERDVEREPGVAAVEPDEAGVAARRAPRDLVLLEQDDRHALAGQEVGGRAADDATADDDHGCAQVVLRGSR